MKTTRKILLAAINCVIFAVALNCDARSTSLTQDELERMQAMRDTIRLQIFYSRWNLTGEPTYPLPLDDLKLMSAEELPAHGTYWSRQRCTAPLPFNPFTEFYKGFQVEVYALPDGTFLLDDMQVDYEVLHSLSRTTALSGESDDREISSLRTSEQFATQSFSLIDTNAAAILDTNLYNACISFPDDTNTVPMLQIVTCGSNAVVIKANHFDYSAETDRDFALVVSANVDAPIWKSIDFLGASDSQDGWLVQGTVPNWKVTDPMFLLVSNIAQIDRAFFRAIPYAGPQIELTGYQPYDVVSNTILLQAIVKDLSGVSNVQFSANVDGLPARYSLKTNNTISLETKYNPNGIANFYLKAANKARVCDPVNPPDNAKLFFSGSASIPLDFQNDTYLLWASDYCPPEIGTNRHYYVTDRPQTITGSVFSPTDGHILKSFGGHVPNPATISVSWNFTEADGTTEYTNATYAVTFQTSNGTTLTITNKIDREGVRPAAGCYLTYQEEDPMNVYYGPGNVFLNDQANTWIKEALKTAYRDLYKQNGPLTQYTTSQVGTNRNHADCIAQDPANVEWAAFLQPAMSNSIYSDFTLAQAHGNGIEIGGGGYFLNRFSSYDLSAWVMNYQPRHSWRMRKVAIWTCFSGSVQQETGNLSFAQACGIRDTPLQMNSFMRKNCGLFFGEKLDSAWQQGGETITSARAAAELDLLWMCGQYPWPGGCDPTYSFRWAVQQVLNHYNQVSLAQPRFFGCPKMIYSSVYDDELMMLDWTHVKEN